MAKVELTTHPKYEFWRYRIFFITWLAYAGFYFTRKAFSVASIGLMKDPNILMDKMDIGAINQAYLIAYACGQFIFGISGDKLGTRKVILAGLLVSTLAGFFMGLSCTVLAFGVLFCIQGLCQSTGWAPLAKNISYFFSQRERGVTMGWWCTNYAVGGMLASPFAGYLADYFTNWRYAFFSTSLVVFGVWLMFVLWQKNKPEQAGLPSIEEYHGEKEAILDTHDQPEEEPEGSWKTIFAVLKNRMILLLGFVYFCLKPTRYAVLFYAPLYVNEKLGTGMGESGLISVAFEAAGPLGVIFGGYMSDKVFKSKRMPISIICLFALAIVLFSFEHLALLRNTWIIAGLLSAVGFLLYVPDSLISGTAAVDFGTKKGASTASGFINGCGSIGAIFGGGQAAAWVVDTWGWNTLFIILGILVCVAGLVLIPKWNAVPATASNNKP